MDLLLVRHYLFYHIVQLRYVRLSSLSSYVIISLRSNLPSTLSPSIQSSHGSGAVGSDRERFSKDEGYVVMYAHALTVGGDA